MGVAETNATRRKGMGCMEKMPAIYMVRERITNVSDRSIRKMVRRYTPGISMVVFTKLSKVAPLGQW